MRHRTRPRRSLLVLLVLTGALLLRADGCITSERELEGVVAVTLTTEWETRGFTEPTATEHGNADEFADDFVAALADADLGAIRRARAEGAEVTVAGGRARVTRNGGHDAPRTAEITVDTGSGARVFLSLDVPGNAEGQQAVPGDGTLTLTALGLDALESLARDVLDLYLADDVEGARTLLSTVQWSATWTTDPEPTAEDPDDFDWVVEVVLHVPARYAIDSIGS